ncbi:MAG: DUF3800 domain-containing protein [Bacteroidales bacterium]|nr:DUF3800 domain-containing protein [Bacteroidales bacterium]MCQ2227949.1 DUF3800 domain-containing protein [Bacteroidales bacterium]
MKKTEDIKAYYFFDEAGDPQILGKRGVNLIERGTASKTFMVGYLETKDPMSFRRALIQLHEKIKNDDYLADIPSINSTNKSFHANKDCQEVRSEVFRLLKKIDFKFYCIVARKDEDIFRRMFDLKDKKIYKYLVSKLLENRLHLYKDIDIYFSAMGNVVRQDTMQEAVNNAISTFINKWNYDNSSTIRILIQQNSEEPLLQAADYVLWTIQRAYERGEFRYYNYLKDKIALVHDIFDTRYYHTKGQSNYYTPNNQLEAKKIDPV